MQRSKLIMWQSIISWDKSDKTLWSHSSYRLWQLSHHKTIDFWQWDGRSLRSNKMYNINIQCSNPGPGVCRKQLQNHEAGIETSQGDIWWETWYLQSTQGKKLSGIHRPRESLFFQRAKTISESKKNSIMSSCVKISKNLITFLTNIQTWNPYNSNWNSRKLLSKCSGITWMWVSAPVWDSLYPLHILFFFKQST